MDVKKCSSCGESFLLKEGFHKDKHHPTGYKSACKICAASRFKNWREQNITEIREKDKINQIKKKYGVTFKEALEYHNNRMGECPICGNIAFRVIDHCHTKGDIRGFICSACNSLLGYAKDNIKTLENAIQYLKDHYEL